MKLGQILALRFDLLPARYCAELSKLLDALPPVPTAAIKRVIETSLGRPLKDLFVDFEDEPLSCASVAQVHGAKLPSGEAVVVKVVRPGSESLFVADLFLVRTAARVFEGLGFGSRLGLRGLARELTAVTREEFDLLRELRNARQMEATIQRDGVDHAVPQTFPAWSSRSVLTMERIDGITASKLIAAVEADDRPRLDEWRRAGVEPRAVAARLLRSMLVQMFRHRIFHADPHSSNILIRGSGQIVLVDFGIFGWLDERQWAHQMRMRHALASNRIHAAYVSLVADFNFPAALDMAAFESEMKEILWGWSQASVSPLASIQEKSAGQLFLRVFDVVRRAGVGIPSGLMRFFRALVISDMVILKLDPSLDILGEVRVFLTEEMTRLTVKATARGAATAPATIARLVAEAPEAALEALEALTEAPTNRLAPRAAPPGTDPLVRVLLQWGAYAAATFTILAAARHVFPRIPGFDELTASIGISVARHPASTVCLGLVCFVLLRRLTVTFTR